MTILFRLGLDLRLTICFPLWCFDVSAYLEFFPPAPPPIVTPGDSKPPVKQDIVGDRGVIYAAEERHVLLTTEEKCARLLIT